MDMELIFPGGKKVDALYKGFTIKTDIPKAHGGEETAPSPVDLFVAALGTCMGFYVLNFCQQREIDTKQVKLILRPEQGKDSKMIEKIVLEIQLPSDFDEKHLGSIVKTAQMCTVKKHLENPPAFEITTKIL